MNYKDLLIKKITNKDVKILYNIRNHPSVRKNLINNKPLDYQQHLDWFKNKLLPDKKQLHFLVKYKNKYIGLVLLRNINKQNAEIGIMFKKTPKIHWPIIYSTAFLLNYAFETLKLKELYSYVFSNNKQAIKFNHGFSGKATKTDELSICKYTFCKLNVNKNYIYKRALRTFIASGCIVR